MAYNLGGRFPPPPESFTLLDPGAYQKDESSKIELSKAPFLSKCPRITQPGARIWTHTIYHADLPPKIPNCTAMMSKRPRFPYEALSKEDLEDILCRCEIQNVCECSAEEKELDEPEFICKGKIHRRLFKGHPPRSSIEEGLSAPSKRDRGFKVRPDGTQKRLVTKVSDESPPFYDIRVDESTAFYQGCKWSRWTSKRSSKEQEHSPGPAEYTSEREPTEAEICAEAERAYRRKRSKQLRFIEMIQQRDILEGRPGPATYSLNLTKGTDLQFLGPKAERFPINTDQHPGPADHWIKRDFDLPISPLHPCHARLPEPSFFGVKAQRFKPRKEEGASPATYSPGGKECLLTHCPTAAFGSSSVRFKQEPIDEDDDIEIVAEDEPLKDSLAKDLDLCPKPTWEFRSKTIRMKPLEKNWHEQSPADLPQPITSVKRLRQFQYTAPFFTSEGRFLPWNDWMPVFGKYETPGPCYYDLEKPKCNPAVCRGPLVRTRRFSSATFETPSPNEYNVGGGIETVLATHNQKLKDNMDNQHKFHWEPPVDARKLSFEEQETLLLNRSIALLDGDIFDQKPKVVSGETKQKYDGKVPKMLRCFLYRNPIPNV